MINFRLVFTVCMLCVAAQATMVKSQPYGSESYANLEVRLNYSENGYRDYGAEWTFRRPLGTGAFWISQKLVGISGRHDDGRDVFSFQGPVSFTNWILARLVAGRGVHKLRACNSGLFTVLSLPSTEIQRALTRNFFVGIANNTEYIFARAQSGSRGVFYTPSVSFSIWGYPRNESADAWAIRVHIGRTFFWNFEGMNYAQGWSFGGTVQLGYEQ